MALNGGQAIKHAGERGDWDRYEQGTQGPGHPLTASEAIDTVGDERGRCSFAPVQCPGPHPGLSTPHSTKYSVKYCSYS